MKTIVEIQRDNLKLLIAEAGGHLSLAERYGCSEANIKTMERGYKDSKTGTPKGIGPKSARKLETCMNKERGWLDNDHSDNSVEVFRKLPTEVQAWIMRQANQENKSKGNGTQ